MDINFDIETIANNSISIDEIGHCCIKATNENLEDYYFITQTALGKSLIFTYGPIIPDLELLPEEVSCTIKQIDYDAKKLGNAAKQFLNDYKKGIKYAEIWSLNDCLNSCVNLIEYARNYEVMYGKNTN